MKITVFIYDKNEDCISTRRIKKDTLDDVLKEYGSNIEYVITDTLDVATIEKVYNEFSNKIYRQLSGS